MSVSIGRHEIEVEVVGREGESLITIMSRPMPVHSRADGSLFVVLDGKRRTI